MWLEELKKIYSKQTLEDLNGYVASSSTRKASVRLMKNNSTDLQDYYYPTALIMYFERQMNLDNSQRAFPQE